jgi:AcrR family transcriptional regulator
MVQTSPTLARPEATGPTADLRRREILAAASRLFRAKGLHGAGMREIAAELGMTAGSLYYYFPSKQALLAYCQEATLDALLEATEATGTGGGVAAELRRLVEAHVVTLNETYPGSLAHLETDELAPAARRALRAKRKEYERRVAARIEAGIGAGELRPCDPRLAALALLGAMNWTVKWFSAEGGRSAREVGAEFADLLLDGLRRRDAPSRRGEEGA